MSEKQQSWLNRFKTAIMVVVLAAFAVNYFIRVSSRDADSSWGVIEQFLFKGPLGTAIAKIIHSPNSDKPEGYGNRRARRSYEEVTTGHDLMMYKKFSELEAKIGNLCIRLILSGSEVANDCQQYHHSQYYHDYIERVFESFPSGEICLGEQRLPAARRDAVGEYLEDSTTDLNGDPLELVREALQKKFPCTRLPGISAKNLN